MALITSAPPTDESRNDTSAPTQGYSRIEVIAAVREYQNRLAELEEEIEEYEDPPLVAEVKKQACQLFVQTVLGTSSAAGIELFSDENGGLAVSAQNSAGSKKLKVSVRPDMPVEVARITMSKVEKRHTPLRWLGLESDFKWLEG